MDGDAGRRVAGAGHRVPVAKDVARPNCNDRDTAVLTGSSQALALDGGRPSGYMQVGSEIVCYSPFGWWTNLQGGAPVTIS